MAVGGGHGHLGDLLVSMFSCVGRRFAGVI